MVPVVSPVSENFAALVGSVPSLNVTPSAVASNVATLPVAPLATSGVAKLVPLLLTFSVKLSSANRPSKARVLNPFLKVIDASLPTAALLTAISIPAPALFISTLGLLTFSRLVVSAVAPPTPTRPAESVACGIATAVTLLAKVTVGELTTSVPKAPATADPTLTTVVDPETPALPISTVLVAAAPVAPLPSP